VGTDVLHADVACRPPTVAYEARASRGVNTLETSPDCWLTSSAFTLQKSHEEYRNELTFPLFAALPTWYSKSFTPSVSDFSSFHVVGERQ
jgi:hypothetical protein